MLELSGTPLFLFVPFIAFSLLFLLILAVKLCLVATSRRSVSRGHRRRRATITTDTSTDTSGTYHFHAAPASRVVGSADSHLSPTVSSSGTFGATVAYAQCTTTPAHSSSPRIHVPPYDPPGYYSGILSTSESGCYPMYVPPYPTTGPPGALPASFRDPHLHMGLAGVAAPPPYPPPPAYASIARYPELPGASRLHASSSTPSTSTTSAETPNVKISEFPPVT